MSRYDLALGKTPEPEEDDTPKEEQVYKSEDLPVRRGSRPRISPSMLDLETTLTTTQEDGEGYVPWRRSTQPLPPIRPLPEGYTPRSENFRIVCPGGSRVIIPINNLHIDFGPRSMTVQLSEEEARTIHQDIDVARPSRLGRNR